MLAVFNLRVGMTLQFFIFFYWLMNCSAAYTANKSSQGIINCIITLNISTGELWQVPRNYFKVQEVGEEVKRVSRFPIPVTGLNRSNTRKDVNDY